MRKILTYIWPLLVLIPALIFAQPIGRGPIGGGGGGGGVAEVQDEAFSAANFNGDTTHATSQDDFYDRIHLYDADDDGSFADEGWFPAAEVEDDVYGAGWNGDTTHAPSQNAVYDRIETLDAAKQDVITYSKGFAVNAATASDDFLLWRSPQAITITNIHGVLLTGTNVVGGVDECDSNGANPVAVDSDITFNGSLDSDDGALSNPSIDSGDWVKWHTTSVSAPGYLTVTIYYTVD